MLENIKDFYKLRPFILAITWSILTSNGIHCGWFPGDPWVSCVHSVLEASVLCDDIFRGRCILSSTQRGLWEPGHSSLEVSSPVEGAVTGLHEVAARAPAPGGPSLGALKVNYIRRFPLHKRHRQRVSFLRSSLPFFLIPKQWTKGQRCFRGFNCTKKCTAFGLSREEPASAHCWVFVPGKEEGAQENSARARGAVPRGERRGLPLVSSLLLLKAFCSVSWELGICMWWESITTGGPGMLPSVGWADWWFLLRKLLNM